jgi:hypothetical protein
VAWLGDALRRLRGADRGGGWVEVVRRMTGPLQETRRVWFEGLILAFDREAAKAQAGIPKPLERSLGGEGEAALIGFQAYLVLAMVVKHQYIPQDQGTEFATALFEGVSGPVGDGAKRRFVRYWDTQNDRASLMGQVWPRLGRAGRRRCCGILQGACLRSVSDTHAKQPHRDGGRQCVRRCQHCSEDGSRPQATDGEVDARLRLDARRIGFFLS